MIGQAVKHGRSGRDARNLCNHLLKDSGARIEMLNSAASTLEEIMDDMMLARDGSRAKDAFLHLSISPSRDMSDDELRQVAGIVARHFGAEDHQAALVFHDKDRASGKGNRHAHFVLGKVGPDGQVIPAGFEKIRMETAMRLAEFEMKESATLGRHHASSIKWLRENGREDVATWLEQSHGATPEKPTSAASPAKRQKIERVTGTDLTTVIGTVRSAWERSDNGKSFSAALAEAGFDVAPGKKTGVYIISKNGTELGALDRLLKQKRGDVARKMGGNTNEAKPENPDPEGPTPTSPSTSNEGTRRGRVPESRAASSPPATAGNTGAEGGRSHRAASGNAGSDPTKPETLDDANRGYGSQVRRLEQFQAVRQIEAHPTGWERLRELRDDFVEFLRGFVTSQKDEPTFSERDRQIAGVFEKAARFSAESMELLERVDPDLSAYRELYGGQCRGLSRDEILHKLEDWREQGAKLRAQQSELEYEHSTMRFG